MGAVRRATGTPLFNLERTDHGQTRRRKSRKAGEKKCCIHQGGRRTTCITHRRIPGSKYVFDENGHVPGLSWRKKKKQATSKAFNRRKRTETRGGSSWKRGRREASPEKKEKKKTRSKKSLDDVRKKDEGGPKTRAFGVGYLSEWAAPWGFSEHGRGT